MNAMKAWKTWSLCAFLAVSMACSCNEAKTKPPEVEPGEWPLTACVAHSDCTEPNTVCIDGICQAAAPNACTPACTEPEVCIQGKCQQTGPAGCVVSSDCVAAGTVCVGGICQVAAPNACTPACTEPEVCVQGKCQQAGPAGCVVSSDCVAAGTVCVGGICQVAAPNACTPACTEPEVCVQGKCQQTVPAGCVVSSECIAPGAVCVRGVCRIPNPDSCPAPCPLGEVCIDRHCQPVSNSFHTKENLPDWGLDGNGNSTTPNVAAVSLGVAEGGKLLLAQRMRHSNHMWLADTSTNDMVSKFDMKTGKEVARYYSVVPLSCKDNQRPEDNNCTPFTMGDVRHHPSRTAIDVDGNAWVANRGFGGLSSVTKIAGDKSFCVDRNGNGHIETSADLDGSGAIEPTEVLPLGEDECVLFTTPVCSGHNGARALAIDGSGDVWVGCYDERAGGAGSPQGVVYQLDSKNGRIKRGPIELGIQPYGAIVDGKQNLWLNGSPGAVVQGVNTRTGEVLSRNSITGQAQGIAVTLDGCSAYGLAVDQANRVWLASINQMGAVACAYEHYVAGGPRWRRCALNPGDFNYARGIAIDAEDNIYLSSSSYGTLMRFKWNDAADTCSVAPITGKNSVKLGIGNRLLGIGFDLQGNPWTVALGTQAARLDLKTGDILKTTLASDYQPEYYTYSDFTGHSLQRFLSPRGTYQQVVEGCPDNSSWKSIAWERQLPEGTRLSLYVQVANTREDLLIAPRHGPFETSPVDLSGIPPSTLLQLEFVLEASADLQSSPVVSGYQLQWTCK